MGRAFESEYSRKHFHPGETICIRVIVRQDDYGPLWEHLVLEYLEAHVYEAQIQYWRTAEGREVDFVIARNRDEIDAIGCKWNPEQFDPTGLKVFRALYPRGDNYLVSPNATQGYHKKLSGMDIYVCNPTGWRDKTQKSATAHR